MILGRFGVSEEVFAIILVAWCRFLGSFWCPGGGFWPNFSVLVAVFAIRSLSRVRLGAENQVEPSSGTSRTPSGVVWEGPGGSWRPIWGAFSSFFDNFLEVLSDGALRLDF